ncbi:MAG: hypothetical protein IH623_29340 [Verrucomicrobia bacterium]|nr:hypothetical protein [Verrucomicrobiota bacterium]
MMEVTKTDTTETSTHAAVGDVSSRQKSRSRVRRWADRPRATGAPRGFFQPLPLWVWVVTSGLAFLGVFSSNPVLTPFSILMLPVLASLLWFQGEPPVLLFACYYQWLQASVAIFYTDFYGISLGSSGPQLVQATWLSLLGILVLGTGMRLALVKRSTKVAEQAASESGQLRPGAIFALYLAAYTGLYFVGKVALLVPGLRQVLVASGSLKWVLVFLLAYAVARQHRAYGLLAIAVALEFFTGILGFFSGFKGVFFVLLVVLPSAHLILRGWHLAQFSAAAAIVLALALVWTVIKADYREFLNQGSGQQVVLVPVPERVAKLQDLVSGLNLHAMEEGLDNLILRVGYVNYFALTLVNVPHNLPHERGQLWLGAVKHVLMPRMLFPDKPVLDDSARTSYYTGMMVAGAEQGTSISIGYMGESYIDFGRAGMFAPILLLGLFYGGIYRFFVHSSRHAVLGYAFATAILIFGAYNLETSNVKLVGGNVMAFLVMALFHKVAGEWVWRLVTNPGGTLRPRRELAKGRGVTHESAEDEPTVRPMGDAEITRSRSRQSRQRRKAGD